MKRCILLFISVLFISSFTNAQYKISKTKYDSHSYSYQVGDPYNPVAVGVTSIIPGLGQIISGEAGRGFVFLGGFSVCVAANTIGMIRVFNAIGSGLSGEEPREGGLILMIAGSIGMVTIDIWSIIDAVHVTKINNLAFRDKRKASYNLQIQSFVNTTYSNKTGSIPVGIILKVIF
jgi:hypothetical protein